MKRGKKYMKIGNPNKTRHMEVSDQFAKDAGWIPYEQPEKIEAPKPKSEPKSEPKKEPKKEPIEFKEGTEPFDASAINIPNLDDQIEKPDEINKPLKPKATRKKTTRKTKAKK